MGTVFTSELRDNQANISLVASSVYLAALSRGLWTRLGAEQQAGGDQHIAAWCIGFASLVSLAGVWCKGLTKVAVVESTAVANFLVGSHFLTTAAAPRATGQLLAIPPVLLALDLCVQSVRFWRSSPQQRASQLDELEQELTPLR